jgi:drug/metabolite transporter (DMT)-like permease
MTALAILLAVLGAGLSAVGVQLQAEGVRHESTDESVRPARLARNRRWLLGLVVLFVCACLQIAALAMAPVTVVAPIVVLALPVIVVLNARATNTKLGAATEVAVTASTGGVALFVTLAAQTASPVGFSETAVLGAAQLVGAVVVLLAIVGATKHGIVRCVAFAAGTGAAYGLVSVLVRDVTFTFQHGGVTAVSPLSAAGLVIAFATGSWLLQLAYASGPPDVVVGCQTVLNPLVATGLGIGLLDETVNAGGWRGVGLVLGGALAITGVAVLARRHPNVISGQATTRAASPAHSARPPRSGK